MKLIKRFLNHQIKELNTIFKKKVKEELIRNFTQIVLKGPALC